MSKDEYDEIDNIAKEITQMNPNTENMSAVQETALDDAIVSLDDLETISDLKDLELAEEEIVEDEPLNDDILDELDMAIDKAEAYESQKSTTIATADPKEAAKGTTKAKGKGTKRVATPRVSRDLTDVPAANFVLSGDVSSMKPDDLETAKSTVIAAKPAQVKVAEKFENLFQSMAAGRAPSKYVVTAFEAIEAKNTISSAEIIGAFKASGVGEGTARSQTGQIMALFPAIGVAQRYGKNLILQADSNVAVYLRKHITA